MKNLHFLVIFLLLSGFTASDKDFYEKLSDAALQLTKDNVMYDPAYRAIAYPNGDVPKNKGVCTDVVIGPTQNWTSIYKKKYTKI